MTVFSSVISYGNLVGSLFAAEDFFADEDFFAVVVLAAGAAVLFLFCRRDGAADSTKVAEAAESAEKLH
jgi:hypothetical protein